MGAHDGIQSCMVNRQYCKCGKLTCAEVKYIQPPRPNSFKPVLKYQKPSVPIDASTTYKKSYIPNDPNEICTSRAKPCLPVHSIQGSPCKMDSKTTNLLSYPGHSEICKQSPIFPHRRSMLGTGPMQSSTTQKHDFVSKPACKRESIPPASNIKCNDVALEDETVQKLSFQPPDLSNFSAAASCRPLYKYERPQVPMEGDTIQKLSYLPVSPSIKEEIPWAKRNRIPVPDVPIEQKTTYKLSFILNGGVPKSKPLKAVDNQNLVTSSAKFEDDTVYKESFFGPDGYYKRPPILPTLTLHNSDAKIDPNSVYHLSYPSYTDVEKRRPILPHARYLLGSGPLDDMTTQKHDFVDKPLCRRDLIRPSSKMEKLEAPLEKTTTSKLSYMKPAFMEPSTSYRPKDGITKSDVSMDDNTIQRLSYKPVLPHIKEEIPWATRKIHNSDQPMDFKTTQHLSFMPPGTMLGASNGCSCSKDECLRDNYPKADSYDE